MNLSTARKNLEPITRNEKKIYPHVTNDWILKIKYNWSSGSRVIIESEKLDEKIDISEAGLFLEKNILNGKIKLDNDKIIGEYAYTKNGFITEDEYMISEDIVEQNENIIPLKPSELEEGIIYVSEYDDLYLYVGEMRDTFVIYKENNLIKIDNILEDKVKTKYLVKVKINISGDQRTISFLESVKRTAKLKLISEVESVSEEILNKGKNLVSRKSGYVLLGLLTKDREIKTGTEKLKSYINTFIEYSGSYYIKGRYIYNGDNTENIIEVLGKRDKQGFYSYKKIKNIDKIKAFIKSEDEMIESILEKESCYIDLKNKNIKDFFI